ncbi:MAG TPA: electron transfer flavoprotein subunit alpha/FixB family protein [Spirochaetia bacterium]|nr:electron transfer flavoprotein subunit alpha/FixB family protein [Spirochaetales bacterium]HPD80745.1 electron transfer flavoprotein subunit alpha/FixB family protein [Spirochaetales bacterium]HQK34569.1 electron transfer flavoprotein subunit alpha/FixB family protein [Spirochaetales bacterium]HRS64939.1 electron transfer flavoprotein subunit alpha/FixB family protein [Spirochaetia bacterium]
MQTKNNVMVFIQQDGGTIADVSIELVSKARELADTLGVGVDALVIGNGMKEKAQLLWGYGADNLYCYEHEKLAHFLSLPYAEVAIQAIKIYEPQIVLFGATTTGRDLAPRIASALKVGLTADCTDLQIGDHELQGKVYKNILYQIRPAFGGNIIATIVSPEKKPQMATVREGVMKISKHDPKRKGHIEVITPELKDSLFITELVKLVREEKTVNLKGAQIIVAGGAGVGSKEDFELIKQLAHVLGGEVGASRAAVDAGWISKAHQVGQTGTTVRPKLYIACGISGSIQHRAGMAESSRIIAINTDPQAPIFQVAHYGIVGDLKDVIPMFINAYKNKE